MPISQEEVEKIALELYSQGYTKSEALSILKWKVRNYPPESKEIFEVLDAYMNYLQKLKTYSKK